MAAFVSARLIITLSLTLSLFVGVYSVIPERQQIMTGGLQEVAVDSPEVTRLAKVVTDKLTEGDNKERNVVEVVKAEVQVVSGTLTHLTLKISDGAEERLYKASIWEQPWLNKTEITKLEAVESV